MLPLDCIVLVQKRGINTGAVRYSYQHGSFRYAELIQLFIKEILCGSIHTIHTVSEIDRVQIALQNVLFAVLHFQTGCIKKFLHFPR